MCNEELIKRAAAARMYAYAPYSHYAVGCALLAEDGQIFTGCNVENASYGATCCAERNAFGAAIAAGHRRFQKIAIVGGKSEKEPTEPCTPCGICRQVMREFCADSFEILTQNGTMLQKFSLSELLPHAFTENTMED